MNLLDADVEKPTVEEVVTIGGAGSSLSWVFTGTPLSDLTTVMFWDAAGTPGMVKVVLSWVSSTDPVAPPSILL